LDTGFSQYISDIAATSGLLAWTLLTAFLVGFLYLIVLRLCGGPMVWISIVLLIIGNIYGGFMLYQTSLDMLETDKYKNYYLYGSYVVWGLAAIMILCVLCNFKNIKIGVAVMKCTA